MLHQSESTFLYPNTRYRVQLFLFLILLIAFQKPLSAQDDQSSSSSRSSFQGSVNLPGQVVRDYYVDPFSMEIVAKRPPLENFIDPSQYQLGPYDILSIDTKGGNGPSVRSVTVNAQGDVMLPMLGTISIKGMTINEAEQQINRVYQDNFKDTSIELTLDSPRPVFVHISGDIPQPGKYMLPAGTRVNFILNGPLISVAEQQQESTQKSRQGSATSRSSMQGNEIQFQNMPNYESLETTSVSGQTTIEPQANEEDRFEKLTKNYNLRNVKIIRDDTLIYADLITYLRAGHLASNPPIQNGDVIVIEKNNPREPRIAISGAVHSPVEILYRSSDTIKKLIDIAGGYRSDADTTRITIQRPTMEGVKEIQLSQPIQRDVNLHANDRVLVPFDTSANKAASVWIYGEVKQPGNYPIQEDESTIADVLEMTGGLNGNALKNGAYLVRNPSEDRSVDPSIEFNPTSLFRTSSQFLQGFDYLKLEQALGQNRMPLDLSDRGDLKDTKLTDGDKIYIPHDYQTVILFGQLNNPGYYNFNSEKTYKEYIDDAAGMTIAAEEESIFIIKAGSRAWYKAGETDIESGDIIFVDRRPFDDFMAYRSAELQKATLRTNRFNTALSVISTVAAAITTYIAVTR